MKEIKFRAWTDGSMEYQSDYVKPKHGSKYSQLKGLITCLTEESVLMQWTGLLDKNGKEIYEGDIISSKPYIPSSEYERIISQVIFREDLARWNAEGIGKWEGETDHLYEANKSAHETEVIGNIYENESLLTP